jgi:hypothetical protein
LIENWIDVLGHSTVSGCATRPDSYVIRLQPAPFTQHVNIPDSLSSLKYASALPGVIRGIFEVFHYSTTVTLTDDDEPGTVISVHIDGAIPPARRDEGG